MSYEPLPSKIKLYISRAVDLVSKVCSFYQKPPKQEEPKPQKQWVNYPMRGTEKSQRINAAKKHYGPKYWRHRAKQEMEERSHHTSVNPMLINYAEHQQSGQQFKRPYKH